MTAPDSGVLATASVQMAGRPETQTALAARERARVLDLVALTTAGSSLAGAVPVTTGPGTLPARLTGQAERGVAAGSAIPLMT
jgi:prophage DNA circulation protein